MGYNNRRAVVITVILLVVLIGVVSCIVIKSKPSGPAAPVSTVEPLETEDCDDEDRAKKQVEECGLGVLIPTAKKTPTKPVVTPPRPRNTRR